MSDPYAPPEAPLSLAVESPLWDGPIEQTDLVRNRWGFAAWTLFAVLAVVIGLFSLFGSLLTLALVGFEGIAHLTADNVGRLRVANTVGQMLFLLLPTLALARLHARRPARYLQWIQPARPGISLGLSAVAMLVGYPFFGWLATTIGEWAGWPEWLRQLQEQAGEMAERVVSAHSLPELLWVVVVAAVTPAVCEELIFRGYALHNWHRSFSAPVAIGLSGVLFGLIHIQPITFLSLALLGCTFGWMTLRTGSVWPAIVGHFVNNLVAVGSLYGANRLGLSVASDEVQVPTGLALASLILFGLALVAMNRLAPPAPPVADPIHPAVG